MISRIQQQFLLGLSLIAVTGLVQSAEPAKSTAEPPPVLQKGSRVVAGDPGKNEFYILSDRQPDPVIYKKGSGFVNAQPLRAGVDPYSILTANADDTLRNASDAQEAKNQERNNARAMQANVASVNNQQTARSVEVKERSNLQKVKAALHKLTLKIADKKKHSTLKTRLASASKHKRIKHHYSSRVKVTRLKVKHVALRAVKHKSVRQHKQVLADLPVLRVGYVA